MGGNLRALLFDSNWIPLVSRAGVVRAVCGCVECALLVSYWKCSHCSIGFSSALFFLIKSWLTKLDYPPRPRTATWIHLMLNLNMYSWIVLEGQGVRRDFHLFFCFGKKGGAVGPITKKSLQQPMFNPKWHCACEWKSKIIIVVLIGVFYLLWQPLETRAFYDHHDNSWS